MSDPRRSEDASPGSAGAFIQEKVVPLLAEPTLGPVWLVLAAHLAAFGAWALLLALEEGRISAYLGVFGLVWLTGTAAVAEIRHRHRPGALCAFILLVWALTAGFAAGAKHWGIF
jgi:hypothetical protein